MRALSIMQPWASAIVALTKRIENRSWAPPFRGPFFIHASKGTGSLGDFSDACDAISDVVDDLAWTEFRDRYLGIRHFRGDTLFIPGAELPRGGIIGRARIVDKLLPDDIASERLIQANHPEVDLRWHNPTAIGFILADVRATKFVPMRGELGFFDVPESIAREALGGA